MIIRSDFVLVVIDTDTYASVGSNGGLHGSKVEYISEIAIDRYWKSINQIFKYGD